MAMVMERDLRDVLTCASAQPLRVCVHAHQLHQAREIRSVTLWSRTRTYRVSSDATRYTLRALFCFLVHVITSNKLFSAPDRKARSMMRPALRYMKQIRVAYNG